MGASFLITLREGLEVSLVLAILIAYLVQTDRRHETGAVWRGAGLAASMCAAVGWIIFSATGGLHGTAEQIVEGGIALVAAAVLTWMIFWMRANARTLGAELRGKVDAATTARGLALVAFVATVREGLETALFLLSAETDAASGVEVVVGGLIGLAAAALLGWIVYRGGSRLDLRRFFQITGILLILFAAGLVGESVHEFREALGFETGGVVNAAWTIRSGPWADGTFYDFLKGFFGWHAETEWIRLIAYVGYLAPVLWLFLWAPSPSPSERSASGRTAVEA